VVWFGAMTTTGTRASCDRVIDAFVERINREQRERLDGAALPDALRLGPPDGSGTYDWRIAPAASCSWISELEERLPGALSPSYRSLVCRYLFPSFRVGNVLLFASTGDHVELELADTIFKDPALARVMLAGGFVQIGRYRDLYDPVCLDLSKRAGGGECPLVRLDHEEALIHGRAKLLDQVAGSFLALFSA